MVVERILFDEIHIKKPNRKLKKYRILLSTLTEKQIDSIENYFRCYWNGIGGMDEMVNVYKENKKVPRYIIKDMEKYGYIVEQSSMLKVKIKFKKNYKYKQGR